MAAIKRAPAVGMPVTTPSAGPIHWVDGARVRLTRRALAVIIQDVAAARIEDRQLSCSRTSTLGPQGHTLTYLSGGVAWQNNRVDVVNNNENTRRRMKPPEDVSLVPLCCASVLTASRRN